jgi:hypothetical protein
MKTMIDEGWMRGQFRLHVLACLLLVAAIAWPWLAGLAGGALGLSAVLLGFNMLAAARRYSRHGGRFS